jgi:anthranilate phosphoribosyltransferase
MKAILNQLFEHKPLDREQARAVLQNMALKTYNEAQIAAFITVYLMRSITEEELSGFRDAILDMALPIDLGPYHFMDVCGTGGDGKNTFNISTLSAFVIAGAGYKVVKHGNYGVSSISGSSNVMESLGYRFTTNESELKAQLRETNLCFLHAPLFHPALQAVTGIRKQLGIKTFFNMLGPLVNPARPKYQQVGVFNLALQRLYTSVLSHSHDSFSVIYDLQGYDEISLTGEVKVMTHQAALLYTPSDLGMPKVEAQQLSGGQSIEEGKTIFLKILNGEGSLAQRSVVLANAAMAITTQNEQLNYYQALEQAQQSLEQGRALGILNDLLKAC